MKAVAASEIWEIEDIAVTVTRKRVKHLYLTVSPPDGAVALTLPRRADEVAAHAFVSSRLRWIRTRRTRMRGLPKPVVHAFVSGETHWLWGEARTLTVIERDAPAEVRREGGAIHLRVRPGTDVGKRRALVHAWHRRLLREAVMPMVATWEARMGVHVAKVYLQRMKTRWGSCNPRSHNVRFNAELVEKRPRLLEYVVIHELAHLIEPSHNKRFQAVMDQHCPDWRTLRDELNGAPRSQAAPDL